MRHLIQGAYEDPFSCQALFDSAGRYASAKLIYVDTNGIICIAKHFVDGAAANRSILTQCTLNAADLSNLLSFNPDFSFNTGPINSAGKAILNQDFRTVFDSTRSRLDSNIRLYTPHQGWEAGGHRILNRASGVTIKIIR